MPQKCTDPVRWSSGSALCTMSRTVHHCPCVSHTVADCGGLGKGYHSLGFVEVPRSHNKNLWDAKQCTKNVCAIHNK